MVIQKLMSTFVSAIIFSLILSGTFFQKIGDAQALETLNSIDAESGSKSTKRMKGVRSGRLKNNRALASGVNRNRYIAQSDLDSDLDAELDEEIEMDSQSGGGKRKAQTNPDDFTSESLQTPALGEEVQISDIKYDSKRSGGTVVVTTSSPATYRTREVPGQNQVVIEIANAKLPEKLKRPFNTKDFKQDTISINAYQDSGSNTARIVLQYRQPRSVDVRQSDRTLSIVATGSSFPSREKEVTLKSASAGQKNQLSSQASSGGDRDSGDQSDFAEPGSERQEQDHDTIIKSRLNGDQPTDQGVPPKIMSTSSLQDENTGDTRFFGRPISIEVRDTAVRDVITLISDQSGANIIMSDDINGNITIKLRQVPWDQALSIVMKTRGLGYVRQGNVLRIAPIRQLQSEAEDARKILEAQEATLPLRVKVIPVSFASVSTLATQIRNTLQASQSSSGAGGQAAAAPTGRGRIEADSRSSSIIVTDTEDNIKRIEQLVAALDTAPLQVMIEGKIVEAKEDMSRNFGINWGYTGEDIPLGGLTFSQSGRIAPPLGNPVANLDFRLGTLNFFGDLNAKLALFERQSMAKIISSPRVVTMNAQQATIDQAIQIPVPTQVQSPGGSVTTQPIVSVNYRSVPTTLTVTPQITSGGDILMQITFKREFLGSTGTSSPPIESRNVQTNVMVKNGQTAVIGGVYQSDTTESETGVPYLRHVPVLGWLFKSTEKTSLRNELLVFITPRILNADRTLPKGRSVE
jgi:type IV pilus assembly protein PilQ